MISQTEAVDFEELVGQARLGDSKSMDKLIQVVQPRLEAYLYRITFDREAVKDIVQDVLLRMIESLYRLRKVGSFWSWLFHMASNSLNDYLRKYKRLDVVRFSALEPNLLENTIPDTRGDFKSDIAGRELSILIGESISKLRERSRAIVRMRCFYGMSYFQIGNSVGCSEATARALFSRAKRKIRGDLQRQMSSNARIGEKVRHLLPQQN